MCTKMCALGCCGLLAGVPRFLVAQPRRLNPLSTNAMHGYLYYHSCTFLIMMGFFLLQPEKIEMSLMYITSCP